jgi:hypothetical protein
VGLEVLDNMPHDRLYFDEKKIIKLILQVGPMKDKIIRNKFINELFQAFGKKSNRKVTDQYTVILSEKTEANEESDLLDKMKYLHGKFEDKIQILENLLKDFDFKSSNIDELALRDRIPKFRLSLCTC